MFILIISCFARLRLETMNKRDEALHRAYNVWTCSVNQSLTTKSSPDF